MSWGTVFVQPHCGNNLKGGGWGRADPYVVISVGPKEEKTEVDKNAGGRPKWNSRFTFPVNFPQEMINFRVMDKDKMTADDVMGQGSYCLGDLTSSGTNTFCGDIELKNLSGKPSGSINVTIEVKPH